MSLIQLVNDGDHDAIRRLILSNKIDLNEGNALEIAICNGDKTMAQLLIDEGAYINLCNPNTGIMPIYHAIESNDIGMVTLLLSYGPDHLIDQSTGMTSLHLAIRNDNLCMVGLLLSDPNIDVNAITDIEKESPLHYAVHVGNEDIVDFLLINKSTNVNAMNINGETPLLSASKYGHVDICKKLIHHGAYVGLADADGMDPLSCWVHHGNGEMIAYLNGAT